MSHRDLDAVMFIREPPMVSYEEGLFHVCYDIGNIHAEFVMQPKVFSKAMLFAEEARAKWHCGTMDNGNVHKIGRRR